MVATEAKYHPPCLLKLYNKRWKFVDDYQDDFAQGMCCIGSRTLPVLLWVLTKPHFTDNLT